MDAQNKRVLFLDFMRGFAVIFMVIGHSIDSVLSLEIRSTAGFQIYNTIRGFTAPVFLFVSGYAYIVATGKNWGDYQRIGSRSLKRLMRIGLLFLIGYMLHVPYLSFEKSFHHSTPEQLQFFFQADVLQCVAATLLVLQVLIFVTPNRRMFVYAVAGVAAVLVLSAPVVWSIDFAPIVGPFFSPYFNQMQPSLFPLFPFAGFMLMGVVVGQFFLEARERHREQSFIRRLAVVALVTIAAAVVLDKLSLTLYPAHDYWKSSPNWFLVRLGIVMVLSAGFYYVRRLPAVLEKNLCMLGQASLFVYTVHLMLVYGSAANNGLYQTVGQTLAAHQSVLVALTVLSTMIALTYVWNYLRKQQFVPTRIIQAGLATTLFYMFFTRPF